jgi:hypothetical protein
VRKLEDTVLVLAMMTGSPEECAGYSIKVVLGPGDGATHRGSARLPSTHLGRYLMSLSFEGAPVSAETDKSVWREAGFELSLATVKKYLAPRPGYPGQLRCSSSDICLDG